jgi:hypothetical protein
MIRMTARMKRQHPPYCQWPSFRKEHDLSPEDFWGALLDRAERIKGAYLDEIARRNLQTAAR